MPSAALARFHVVPQRTTWESFTTSSCQNTLRAAQWVLLYEPTERENGQVLY